MAIQAWKNIHWRYPLENATRDISQNLYRRRLSGLLQCQRGTRIGSESPDRSKGASLQKGTTRWGYDRAFIQEIACHFFQPTCYAVVVFFILINTSGCDSKEVRQPINARQRAVPLRVLLVGSADAEKVIAQRWSGEQDREIRVVHFPLSEAFSSDQGLDGWIKKSDVLIYPHLLQGNWIQEDWITPFSDAFLGAEGLDAERIFPVLRTSTLQYGKSAIAIPLGLNLPSLIVATSKVDGTELTTWNQYNSKLNANPDLRAAEPLADGWAACMFLWRANGYCSDSWLFDLKDFRPLLSNAPYRRALEELVQASKAYSGKRMNPNQIWQSLLAGDLDFAIGWSTAAFGTTAVGDVRVFSLPTGDQTFSEDRQQWLSKKASSSALLLCGRSPVASISSYCRQTALAQDFLRWLTVGTEAAALRQRINRFTITRSPNGELEEDPQTFSASNTIQHQYEDYLLRQASTMRNRTVLRLPMAHAYLDALDREVIKTIDGLQDAATALQAVVDIWEKITVQQGRKQQLQSWHRSMGLRN